MPDGAPVGLKPDRPVPPTAAFWAENVSAVRRRDTMGARARPQRSTMTDEPTVPETQPAAERARLRWLCRRGMKELDELLARYLNTRYPEADAAARRGFERLLELQDPDLYDLLIGRVQADDAEIDDVVTRIRHDARP